MRMRSRRFMTFLISSLIFLVGNKAFAQAAKSVTDNSSYFLNEDNELIQRFTWQGNKNVFRYEFVLEQYDDAKGDYVQIQFIDTKETSVEMPLNAGKYRYYLKIYNYLNYLDYRTEYINFDIVQTYHPIITSVSPTVIYLEEPQSGIFTVEGMELRPDTIFTLENNIYEIQAKVLSTDSAYNRSRIKIDPELLDSGSYYIRAVNPGGLFDTSGTIKITFKKPMDLDVAVGYAPVGLLDIDKTKDTSDANHNDTLVEFFSGDDRAGIFWPLGLDARVTFIPFKTANVFFGTALGINWFRAKYTNYANGKESYTIIAPAYTMHLDFVSQFVLKKSLPWKIVLDAHAGGGLFGFAGLKLKFPHYTSDPLWSADICLDTGVSLQVYRWKRFYFEAGSDFLWAITYSEDKNTGKNSPMMVYYIQPRIGVGWQF